MDPQTSASYHIDHIKISNITGIKLGRIRKLASGMGDLLNPFRVQGDKGVYLYNTDGLKVWELIAQFERRGQTPKTIRKNLERTLGNQENRETEERLRQSGRSFTPVSENIDASSEEVLPLQPYAQDKPITHSLLAHQEQMFEELKESHKREIEAKNQTIQILKDQNALLMAPKTEEKKGILSYLFK